ncbi:MAG: FKBP-type peptidyl-prolyl cis-trans isomerase [Elusimicrobiota bacterium]|nr:FKBP-type peptidyl-prolyl cis-trans isomerase [Elusimicrobiota bacterium]
MKIALISLILSAAPAFAADASDSPKANRPAAKPAAPKEAYKTDDERAIYTIGFLMGRNLSPFDMTPAEVKVVQAGIADSVLNKEPKVDVRFYQPRVNEILSTRLEAANKRKEAAMASAAAPEKEKGRVFTENWVKEHKPQAISGGGWYLETKAGKGPIPAKTATIKAHYRGTTVDGEEFDSSYKRGAPTEFSLDGVIKCWTHGISMMKVGGQAKLVCPSDVAYGDPGRPGIKPGATLVFEVELVEIVKP